MAWRKILFADDDGEIREVVRILLEGEGYEVVEAEDGLEAIAKTDDTVDLIILDYKMPGCSGVTACAEIRKKTKAPILFLTARTQDQDKIMAFSAGCDDYLAKPFSYPELLARVKAMLRRCYVYQENIGEAEAPVIQAGDITVNREFNQIIKDGEEILCTNLEYRILLLLISNPHKVFSAQNIYESVWDEPYFYQSNNTVMVHIRNLRRKLEEDPQNPRYIVNVWGRGYRFG